MSIPKKQHHVWKDYLDPWLVDGSIAFTLDGKVSSTGPGNVAHQRYFYEIGEMTSRDIAMVSSLTFGQQSKVIRNAAESWIESVQLIFKLRDQMVAKGLDRASIDEKVKQASRQLGELYQGTIENSGFKYLPTLRTSDKFTVNEEEDYVEFCYFVMTQYFRTTRARENLKREMDADNPGYVDRSMAAIIPVMATLASAALINKRNELVPTLLLNKSAVNFITGDQPIINTYAVETQKGENIPSTEFYYPISPVRAIIFSDNPSYRSGVVTNPITAREFNRKMALSAERSVFASSQTELQEWKDVVGIHRRSGAN